MYRTTGITTFSLLVAAALLLVPLQGLSEAKASNGLTKSDYAMMLTKQYGKNKYVPKNSKKMSSENIYKQMLKNMEADGIKFLKPDKGNTPLTKMEFINFTYSFLTHKKGENGMERKYFLKDKGIVSENDIGIIKSYEGEATFERHETKQVVPVTGNEPVLFKDIAETAEESRMELQFDDQSVLTLGEETSLEVNEMIFDPKKKTRKTVVKVAYGKIRVKASKLGAARNDLEIVTPTAVIGVRGTEFAVSVDKDGATEIVTLSGLVSVKSGRDDKKEVLLKADMATSVASTGTVSKPKKVSEDKKKEVVENTKVKNPVKVTGGGNVSSTEVRTALNSQGKSNASDSSEKEKKKDGKDDDDDDDEDDDKKKDRGRSSDKDDDEDDDDDKKKDRGRSSDKDDDDDDDNDRGRSSDKDDDDDDNDRGRSSDNGDKDDDDDEKDRGNSEDNANNDRDDEKDSDNSDDNKDVSDTDKNNDLASDEDNIIFSDDDDDTVYTEALDTIAAAGSNDVTRSDLWETISDALDSNDFRERQGALEKIADAKAGRTLKDANGYWVRSQQYLLRPDDKTAEIVAVNYRGSNAEDLSGLTVMNWTTTFEQDLPSGSALRDLPWGEYLTVNRDGDPYINNSSDYSLTDMTVEFTFDSDSITEARTFGSLSSSRQNIDSEKLTVNSSTFNYDSSGGKNTYSMGSMSGGFSYDMIGPKDDSTIEVETFVIGDATDSDNIGEDSDYDNLDISDLWTALAVNTDEGESIGNNNLELTFSNGDSETDLLNGTIDIVFVPIPRMEISD